jgi:hypothetical protein
MNSISIIEYVDLGAFTFVCSWTTATRILVAMAGGRLTILAPSLFTERLLKKMPDFRTQSRLIAGGK